jgi:hypothetical protein
LRSTKVVFADNMVSKVVPYFCTHSLSCEFVFLSVVCGVSHGDLVSFRILQRHSHPLSLFLFPPFLSYSISLPPPFLLFSFFLSAAHVRKARNFFSVDEVQLYYEFKFFSLSLPSSLSLSSLSLLSLFSLSLFSLSLPLLSNLSRSFRLSLYFPTSPFMLC